MWICFKKCNFVYFNTQFHHFNRFFPTLSSLMTYPWSLDWTLPAIWSHTRHLISDVSARSKPRYARKVLPKTPFIKKALVGNPMCPNI